MPLPSFVATGTLNEILGEIAANELVQDTAQRAVISLTSNHNTDYPLIWDDTINWLKQPILARVNVSGEIVNEEGDPLRLLARHEDLVPNLQWSIAVELPPAALPPTPGGRLVKWTIDAGEDGETVDLAAEAPRARVQGVATTRGLRGYRSYAAPIDPDDPASMWQWYDETDQPFGDPFEPFSAEVVSGGTP